MIRETLSGMRWILLRDMQGVGFNRVQEMRRARRTLEEKTLAALQEEV
jgi:hypothetical protein